MNKSEEKKNQHKDVQYPYLTYLECIFGSVEGGGLTINKHYYPICKYKESFCIIDDNDELNAYHEDFFKVLKYSDSEE